MNKFIDKLTRAADAFAEVITEDIKTNQITGIYTYGDLIKTINIKRRGYSQAKKCIISIRKIRKFEECVFAGEKYLIRIVLLDEMKRPIQLKGRYDEYVGSLVIAEAIDERLSGFMGNKTEKTVSIGGR